VYYITAGKYKINPDTNRAELSESKSIKKRDGLVEYPNAKGNAEQYQQPGNPTFRGVNKPCNRVFIELKVDILSSNCIADSP
jgi:hypothetical protein